MSSTPPGATGLAQTSGQTPAQLAKAALRRLAAAQQEPTPENYARAYAEEGGGPAASLMPERLVEALERLAARIGDESAPRAEWLRALASGQWEQAQRLSQQLLESTASASQAWAQTLERMARGLERGGKQWTAARKKESLQHVLEGSRSDAQRLQQRLRQLLTQWEQDREPPADPIEGIDAGVAAQVPGNGADVVATPAVPTASAPVAESAVGLAAEHWRGITVALQGGLHCALQAPPSRNGLGETSAPALNDARARELADELAVLAARIEVDGATADIAAAVLSACERASRWLGHRHHLLQQLGALCRELTEGLAELSEDDSWVRGQCETLREQLADDFSARGVRAAGDLLAHTRAQQHTLRGERSRARDALKSLIQSMLGEIGELGATTGRFSQNVQRYAGTIESAESLDSLAGFVRELVEESRAVHAVVSQAGSRLSDGHDRALALEIQVRNLEGELRRLSDEVMTDSLTQVANRRGLMQAFDVESERLKRQGGTLSIGLIDIDNFKKLNDTLGHAVGDVALKALAQHVRSALRPTDAVARFGGEEFVVLLPNTPTPDAAQILTRLQRGLTEALFLHESREVFVTFSAGVTAWRPGEPLQPALERADEGLYEAKRSGKNRTCCA